MAAREYAVGTSTYRKPFPTFEFKDGSPDHTGGGYPRVRSWEYRPETARQGKEDVYVSIHRLLAVAWLLPDGVLGDDVRLSILDGMDVHHELGMPSANVEDELALTDHGTHSSITQAEMRAWAEEDKRRAFEFDETDIPENRCAHCDDVPDVLCRVPSYDGGDVCLDCSQLLADDEPIEVVE